MVDRHKVKKGIEIYSDPEELFNPIAHRYTNTLITHGSSKFKC